MNRKSLIFLLTLSITIVFYFLGIFGESTLKMNDEKFWGTVVESLTCWSLTWLGFSLGTQWKSVRYPTLRMFRHDKE